MDNFAIISRDDLSRRKVADEMKIAADKQAKYESQLKKMGIPVIVGLVNKIAQTISKRNHRTIYISRVQRTAIHPQRTASFISISKEAHSRRATS